MNKWIRLIRQLKLTRAALAVILLCGLIVVLRLGLPSFENPDNQAALILFTTVVTGLLGALTILIKSIADADEPDQRSEED